MSYRALLECLEILEPKIWLGFIVYETCYIVSENQTKLVL